jgi:hypothetical protein
VKKKYPYSYFYMLPVDSTRCAVMPKPAIGLHATVQICLVKQLQRTVIYDFAVFYRPTAILLLIVHAGQVLVCKHFFLQDKGSVLAVNNR